ncbi:MAG: anthrone oxygenase family protein [Henriciella sp.]
MSFEWVLYLCLFLALWSAVIGGVFSAFSEFVMSGLLRAEPAGGMEAMQHINRTVMTTQFVAGIILITPLSIGFAIYAWLDLDGAAQTTLIAAPMVYLPSVFLMTMLGNVPMNNKLEGMDYTAPESETYWRHYGRVWTRLNHFRTIGSVVTAGLYLAAAVALISSGQA